MRPIPATILKHSATLRVCTGTDAWQKPLWDDTPLDRVCMQPSHETRRTKDNTEVTLRSLLFVDAVRSSPKGIDIQALQIESDGNGAPMQLIFDGVTYTVQTVEKLFDERGILHHWEVGCV